MQPAYRFPAARRRLNRKFRNFSRSFSDSRRRLKRRFGWLKPARIELYRGYVCPACVRFGGRVLEDAQLPPPSVEDGALTNLCRAYRRFETDELPEALVAVESCAGELLSELRTGPSGFFWANLGKEHLQRELRQSLELRLRLESPLVESYRPRVLPVDLSHPNPNAEFGVISDIDDTVLKTNVRNTAKMVLVTILSNALTRLGFEGTRDWYRALEHRGGGAPFFYVSQSPWNIYSLIDGFLRHQALPLGPLALRQAGLVADPERRNGHKQRAIRRIMNDFPKLPFVLIGDSTERDAEIYLDVASKFADRVRAIYIRDVSGPERKKDLMRLARSYKCDAEFVIFDHSFEAMAHGERVGLC